jgi:hypothetical protein
MAEKAARKQGVTIEEFPGRVPDGSRGSVSSAAGSLVRAFERELKAEPPIPRG